MHKIRRAVEIARSEGLGSLLRRVAIYSDKKTGVISFFVSPYARLKLKKILSIDEALEFVSSDSLIAELIKPMQVTEEIAELAKIVAEFRPRTVLEIGTARGGTLFLWTRAAAEDATIVSIDLPGGLFGGGYPLLKSILYRSFRNNKQFIVLLRRDSHDRETLERVKSIFSRKSIDFLFIDGDHRYEGVKKDYEMYSPLVRPGGIIAFHDIVPGPIELVGGVPRFWSELKEKLPRGNYLEIVRDWNQGGYGIGVLFKD